MNIHGPRTQALGNGGRCWTEDVVVNGTRKHGLEPDQFCQVNLHLLDSLHLSFQTTWLPTGVIPLC